MQLQWEKIPIPAMGIAVQEVQNQEQTLEVRLGEDMPDIGHIICGWGQPLLRGKEWRGDSISVSGGVMAWVLYAPEDGSAPRCVEGWLPFQLKWSMPPADRDGVICCDVRLRGVDARVLSARKMMLRAQISALGEALEPVQIACVNSGEVPQHIQINHKTIPVLLRAEAGEVAILVDEDVSISGPKPQKIISCTLQWKLSEQKVVGSRVIFRGDCLVHLNYYGEDEMIYSRELAVPFAQYAQLDRDYDKQATAEAILAVSSLEPELVDEGLRLKCNLVCQYTILDQYMVDSTQDIYSTSHELEYTLQETTMPVVLDRRTERRTIQQTGMVDGDITVDTCCFMEQPVIRRNGTDLDVQLNGTVQILNRDESGGYHANAIRIHDQWSVCANESAAVRILAEPAAKPRAISTGTGMEIQLDLDVQMFATAQETIPQIVLIEVGQERLLSKDRPSLILRRPGDASLWDLAKYYGSTVERISLANDLDAEPQKDKMLLIPIR